MLILTSLSRYPVDFLPKLTIFAVALTLLSGCANLSSIFRTTPAAESEVILIDAKQRAIAVTMSDGRPQICSEKPPDAFSALAASGNLNINLQGEGGGSGAYSQTEQAASIAFRTQVTETQQALLYFYCQLAANKMMSPDEVVTDLRRYQNTMLAMLAVEQLTGVAKPIEAVLTSAPSGSPSKSPSPSGSKSDGAGNPSSSPTGNASTAELSAAQKDVAAKTNALLNIQSKLETQQVKFPVDDPAAIKVEKEEVTKTQADYDTATVDLRTAQEKVAKLKSSTPAKGAKSSPDAVPSGQAGSTGMPNAGAAAAIADAVGTIVQTVVWQTFTTETCLKALFDQIDQEKGLLAPDLREFCKHHLERVDDYRFSRVPSVGFAPGTSRRSASTQPVKQPLGLIPPANRTVPQ
jgi:hypothetical protein